MNSFETYRPVLFGLAYRMLGSAMEAEDIVQEAYLRFRNQGDIENPLAYLKTITTRLCIDHLRSAHYQREQYIGPWLPEPIVVNHTTTSYQNPANQMEQYDSLSMAFLVLLESLTPVERAVFLLRTVFDYSYDELAEVVGKSPSNCRKIYSRAKANIDAHKPRFQASPEEHERVLNTFVETMLTGDVGSLTDLLAEDVMVMSDGGGRVAAAMRPVVGREDVEKFMFGLRRQAFAQGIHYQPRLTYINGQLALIFLVDDTINTVMTTQVSQGKITNIHFVRNPDKLKRLQETLSM